MKAIHFGAGNIGRGFIGKLLADAQIDLTFADVNQPLVDQLAHRQSYQVNVVGKDARIEKVSRISAIHSASPDAVKQISEADIITTAVGPQVLTKIADTLAQGLIARYKSGNNQPLNIIACENMVRGTSQLKQHVMQLIPENIQPWLEEHIGFVDSAVDRIVPPGEAANDPLDVTVETFSEWIVDGTQFKGQLPQIAGMEPAINLMAYIERKLFTLNTGHAITAYLGRLAGCQTIRDAILHPEIRQTVKAAMEESGAVLVTRYNFDARQHIAYIDKILSRFENPYLHDDVERVGRQPLRKLSDNDRLIKPLRGTLEYGYPNSNLIKGIAAAFCYCNSQDPQAQELQSLIRSQGIEDTIKRVCGLQDQPEVVAQITNVYNCMKQSA